MPRDGLIERLERDAGIRGLVAALAERLAPTDLQSLMLEVYSRRAATMTPSRLLASYRDSRFVAPSAGDPRRFAMLEALVWKLLPPTYDALELAPVCPLGTNSAMATVSQNKVVSTARNNEVVADPTNVLALECAVRRSGQAAIRLAAIHRVVRAQLFRGPRTTAHFKLLALAAAGRDGGNHVFEVSHIREQLAFHVRYLTALEHVTAVRVAITDLSGGAVTERFEAEVMPQLSGAEVHWDTDRASGRGYYRDVCFKIFIREAGAGEVEIGDGGVTDWTQRLLGNAKERLVTSGLGLERLCLAPTR